MITAVSAQQFIRSASDTAHHFGFLPIEKLKEHPACKNCSEKIQHKAKMQDRKSDSLHGLLTGGMCLYFENKLNAIEGPSVFYTVEQIPRSGDTVVAFHILNVKKSIAEALLIQTIRSLLTDLGYPEHTVHINSIGDQDSTTRYIRDLTTYLRKRLDEIPPQARELMKEHPILSLMNLIERDHDLVKKSPNPLEYLTDTSRKHFREIVEFLDMSHTPFEIDPRLIGHHDCYTDTLFSFDTHTSSTDDEDSQNLFLIRGGRYSTFVSKMTKTKVPAVGAVVALRNRKVPSTISLAKMVPTPNVYLAQLGFGPKVKSLLLIDELRRSGISVFQNLTCDSLTEQLRLADESKARYAIILGYKEFMEGNVILRDLHHQNQENIPFATVANHLRQLATTARK